MINFLVCLILKFSHSDSPVSDAHVPYILDVLPVLQVSGEGPQQFMRQVMVRWGPAKMPHFIADSAFGLIEMLTEVKGWGGGGTLLAAPRSTLICEKPSL